jgi:hypothetical protein
MSARWTGTGLGVRADVRVLRAHYGHEDLLPGRGVRLPARGRAGGHRRAAGGLAGPALRPTAGHRLVPRSPAATGLTVAPGQMDILGRLSAPGRECGEVNQFRLLAVEA